MSNIHIETLGCRLNQIESESAAQYFLKKDFSVSMKPVTAASPVDEETLLCVINTCTVTLKAEQKARRIIRLMLKLFPNSVVIVTGCYAQLSPIEIEQMDRRIFVLPGQIKSRIIEIPEMLSDYIKNGTWNPQVFMEKLKSITQIKQKITDVAENSFSLSATSFLAHSRASLKIQDGCNSSCSYCAIHMARGKSVSIDVQTAINRVKELEENNFDEVVLTTVNIAQYAGEYNGQILNFAKLLKLMLENTNKINFRISSLYPQIVDDEFCQIISDDRVRPHFHISVQSGSDKILKLMNRTYKAEAVLSACKKLREFKKDCFLACDIITGFPGETDEDFNQTLDLCKKCDFTWIHAFPFSERPGTVAVTLKNKVPQSVSNERVKTITSWAIENKIKYIEKFKGKELNAILETKKKSLIENPLNNINTYHAMSENFIHCEIKTEKNYNLNTQVKIKILMPLPERIKKGGEIEASAVIID